VTVVAEETAAVPTLNVALVAPAVIVTLGGTWAAAALLLESVTRAPPDGAGPLNVTVAIEGFPAVTLVGFSERDEIEMVCGSGACSKSQIAGFGSFSGTATNLELEIM
jgi:hypothetical protein